MPYFFLKGCNAPTFNPTLHHTLDSAAGADLYDRVYRLLLKARFGQQMLPK